MSDTSRAHQDAAAGRARDEPVRCAVLTVSDSRTMATDLSGQLLEEMLRAGGHVPVERLVVPDCPQTIEERLKHWLADPAIQAILVSGGTGVGRRDGTVQVVRRLLTEELEGFGELFRMLSFQQIEGAAMLSRALGGLVAQPRDSGGDTFIFSMPGSPDAVRTAMTRLIGPQLAHLVWERIR